MFIFVIPEAGILFLAIIILVHTDPLLARQVQGMGSYCRDFDVKKYLTGLYLVGFLRLRELRFILIAN